MCMRIIPLPPCIRHTTFLWLSLLPGADVLHTEMLPVKLSALQHHALRKIRVTPNHIST